MVRHLDSVDEGVLCLIDDDDDAVVGSDYCQSQWRQEYAWAAYEECGRHTKMFISESNCADIESSNIYGLVVHMVDRLHKWYARQTLHYLKGELEEYTRSGLGHATIPIHLHEAKLGTGQTKHAKASGQIKSPSKPHVVDAVPRGNKLGS